MTMALMDQLMMRQSHSIMVSSKRLLPEWIRLWKHAKRYTNIYTSRLDGPVHRPLVSIHLLENQPNVQIPNLINSPPYILDILPDIHNHIRLIINEQHSRFDLLTDNDYFQTFISNLAEKLKYLQKVLRNAKGKVQFPVPSCTVDSP